MSTMLPSARPDVTGSASPSKNCSSTFWNMEFSPLTRENSVIEDCRFAACFSPKISSAVLSLCVRTASQHSSSRRPKTG